MAAQLQCDLCGEEFVTPGAAWVPKVCKTCYDKEMAERIGLCVDCAKLLLGSVRCRRFPAYCQDCYERRLAQPAELHFEDSLPAPEDADGLMNFECQNVPEWLAPRLQIAIEQVVSASIAEGELDKRLKIRAVVEATARGAGKFEYLHHVGLHTPLARIMQEWCQYQDVQLEEHMFWHRGKHLAGDETVASLGYGPKHFMGANAKTLRLLVTPVIGTENDGVTRNRSRKRLNDKHISRPGLNG